VFRAVLRTCALTLGVASLAACSAVPRPEPRPTPRARPPVFIPAPKPVPKPVNRPRPIEQPTTNSPPVAMVEGIRALWASYPDRAGVAVARADGNWIIAHRGDELMPQQSVSKLLVAITLMQAVDDGRISLSEGVTVRKSDLTVFSAAMASLVGDDGFTTTYGELLRRALTISDNTANDVILGRVGGASAVRAMISAKGLGAIRFGGAEHVLQSGTAGLPWREEYRQGRAFQNARALLSNETRQKAMDTYVANPPDGAAPSAIARMLIRLKKGELLSPASTQRILGLMAASETGKMRLKAGVPYDWSYAHKTGTGQDFGGRTAGYNDVAIMTAPDGTSYAVVVQIAEARRPVPERQQLMQGISAIVGANHRR
jgi:beta-lactamase class A